MAQIEERRRNWEKALDKGVNIDRAIENLKRYTGPPISVPFVWRHNLLLRRHLW